MLQLLLLLRLWLYLMVASWQCIVYVSQATVIATFGNWLPPLIVYMYSCTAQPRYRATCKHKQQQQPL